MSTRDTLKISALLFVAMVLRIYHLCSQSLWGDEGFSWNLAKNYLSSIINILSDPNTVEVHPPLYYFLLKFWITLFGDSVASMRGLSVFFGVASIVVVYIFAQRSFSSNEAFYIALLITFSPFHIWYSQEARMYSLLAFLTVGAVLSYYKYITINCQWSLIFSFIFLLAGIYTHHYFWLVFSAIFWHWIFFNRKKFRMVSIFIFSLIFYLPWLKILWQNYQLMKKPIGFSTNFSPLISIPFTFIKFFLFGNENFIREFKLIYIVGAVFVAILFLIGLKKMASDKKKMEIWLVFLLAFLPLFLICLGYLIGFKQYRSYSLILISPFYYLILARGFISSNKVREYACAGIVISLNIFTLINLNFGNNYVKPRAKEVVEFIISRGSQTELVFKLPEILPGYGNYSFIPYQYYAGNKIILYRAEGKTLEDISQNIRDLCQSCQSITLIVPQTQFVPEMDIKISQLLMPDFKVMEKRDFPSKIRDFGIKVLILNRY